MSSHRAWFGAAVCLAVAIRVVADDSREVLEIPLKKLADARAGAGKLELLVANPNGPRG